MGKDTEKNKADKSRKAKDGDKNKTTKDKKKSGKEKTKQVDKKCDKTKAKSGKSDTPKTTANAKTPKSKGKSNKEKAKPKSKDGKTPTKKSPNPKSTGKSKTAPKSGATTPAKATPAYAKATKAKPKPEVPKSKKNKVEKSRVEDNLESTISANGSNYSTAEEDDEPVVVVVKDAKKGKATGAKKEFTPVKPKPKVTKPTEPSFMDSEEETTYKQVKEKPNPKKTKKEAPETKGAAKKTDKDHAKPASTAPKKKSPPSSKKNKQEKEKKNAAVHQPPKKVVKPPVKVRSESEEADQKDEPNAETVEDVHQNDPDQTTSVDNQVAEDDEKTENAGEHDETPQEEAAADDQGEPEAEYVNYEDAAAEPMEFTKPTVNQPKGRKETSPMCYSTVIGTSEFEALFDEITELNAGAATLKHSYGSIVTSLVHMHNRRMKAKLPKDQKKLPHQQQINFMTTRSEVSAKTAAQMEDCLEGVDKYDLERFINPVTRDETFKLLFAEIDDLNKKTHKLRTEFFDTAANFLREKYDHQTAYKLDRKRFNQYKLWTKKLSTVVDDISRAYNDDLLNMFRMD